MREDGFEFALKERVKLQLSDETGCVIGRAEYTNSGNSFLVRYKAGDGRQVESWIAADALVSVEF